MPATNQTGDVMLWIPIKPVMMGTRDGYLMQFRDDTMTTRKPPTGLRFVLGLLLCSLVLVVPLVTVGWLIVRHEAKTWTPDDTQRAAWTAGALVVAGIFTTIMERRRCRKRGEKWPGL